MSIRRIPLQCALLALKLYKAVISPLLPPACRYYPTCSQYAFEAVKKYGLMRGGFLALKRILRCNPLFPGGSDPVP